MCQIGSPHSIATFLQRVGRANHHRTGVPRGIVYPTTRDELVECVALLAAVKRGRLDALHPPEQPLDILAQQVVAETAARGEEGIDEDELFALIVRAWPYRRLTREEFDEIVDLVSAGIETGRGRRMAYLHRDRVNGRLRARRGARLATLTSGGAIPETGDYRVLMEPGDVFIGTVNEDFAIESLQGDVFLLGTHPWQIVQVTNGVLRVRDAAGRHPTIPFWVGEAPGRTDELSEEVSALRSAVAERLDDGGREAAIAYVREVSGVDAVAAALVVDYLHAGRVALGGVLPTHDDIVFERFFDESGGMQLIIHAPLGARINRALGLGLRKKFCLNFDFELQAAASNDAALLSLGPQHSFPLEDVPAFLKPGNVQDAVSQAVLRSPMFTARWRWNLNRSLAVLRRKGGRINPFNIQRMESDDLMAAVFPDLAACQDNAPAGPTEIPDHPLVRETMRDCLHEAMDIDGLKGLVHRFEQGTVRVHFIDTVEPSVLAHEILNGQPFTFLDEDAEIGERRSRAVPLRRGLPVEPRELGRLDPDAIERVRAEASPDLRDADELHDLLLSLVATRPRAEWVEFFDALVQAGRSSEVHGPAGVMWAATERRQEVEALFPGATFVPDHPLPRGMGGALDPEAAQEAAVGLVRGHLDVAGPLTVDELADVTGLSRTSTTVALELLRGRGFAVSGHFEPETGRAVVCPPAAGADPRLHARAAPGPGPSHQPGGVGGLPPVLVACHPRDQAPGPGGAGRGDRAVPRLRVAGRRLGAAVRRAGGVLSPGMARRPLPVWRGGVGPAVGRRAGGRGRRPGRGRAAPFGQDARPGGRRSRSCCATTCPGCCRPTAAPRRRPSRPPAPGGRYSTLCAGTVPCSTPISRRSRIDCRPRSRKACGTGSPADSSLPTGSTRSGRCCMRARGSRAASGPTADPVPAAAAARGDRGWKGAGHCCPPSRRRTTSRSWPRRWRCSSCCDGAWCSGTST